MEISGRDPATRRPVTVTVRDGLIESVRSGPVDEQAWLAPGLVDLQVNGFDGHDLHAETADVGTVFALTRSLRERGTTTYVPTVTTASQDRISATLAIIAEARRRDELSRAAIPFIHLEGPYISDQDGPRGVHDAAQVRPPDLAEFDRWQRSCDGLVQMVTLSPHYRDSPDVIQAFRSRGVQIALGHTHASSAQIRAAVDAGACLSTHLGNGAHAILARHPNYIWAQLADDRLAAAFIADGHHLPDDTLTVMLRAKGAERSILVSDAVGLSGCSPGTYRTTVGEVQLAADGRLSHADSGLLAGATQPLADDVARVMLATGIGLAEAVRMATANPARFLPGWHAIVAGAPANLIRFAWHQGDPKLHVLDVVTAVPPE
jgi:N-acetylglucosamine-6-phosphate deacetylase